MSQLRRNIELKARYAELAAAMAILSQHGARLARIESQIDTYFKAHNGRLKLREVQGVDPVGVTHSELIWYLRPDSSDVRESQYRIAPVSDPVAMGAILTAACGLRGEVRKVRQIYMYHNVRIHLDEVQSLGIFVEFEGVLATGADSAQTRRHIDRLHDALGIKPNDHVSGSYADLLGI